MPFLSAPFSKFVTSHRHRGILQYAGIICVISFILFSTIYFYAGIHSVENKVAESLAYNKRLINDLHSMSVIIKDRTTLLYRIFDVEDQEQRKKLFVEYRELADAFFQHRTQLENSETDDQLNRYIYDIKQLWLRSQPLHEQVASLVSMTMNSDARQLLPKIIEAQDELSKLVEDAYQYELLQKNFIDENVKRDFRINLYIVSFGTIFFIIASAVIFLFLINAYNRQQDSLLKTNQALNESNKLLTTSNKEVIRAKKIQSEFIANMSHELRTPMTSIKGALGMLNSDLFQDIDKEVLKLITIADKNTDRMLQLVADVLDFAKLESGDVILTPRLWKVREEFDRQHLGYAFTAKHKGLELDINYTDDAPVEVMLDREYLFKAISQLISNAIKFTEEGAISILISGSNDELVIMIDDSGPGIPYDVQDTIFDEFVQGDGTSTRMQGGTGIGLTICKRIVEAMHGVLDFRSIPGKGSSFWIKVPLNTSSQHLSEKENVK